MSPERGFLPIGTLAQQTRTKVQTIRYYEEIGLLPGTARSEGNQRRYTGRHLERLAFIRHARELGFPLAAIRELMALADDPDRSCAAADAIARHHLSEVERRLRRLDALRCELERMIVECGQSRIADCRVIEVLADASHAHCVDPTHGNVIEQQHGLSKTVTS